jgi:hypothetical protein
MFNVLKLVVLKNNPEYTHSINYGVIIFNEIHMFCFLEMGSFFFIDELTNDNIWLPNVDQSLSLYLL